MTATGLARTFTALREFTRERPPLEWCDVCAAPIAPVHDHLLDPGPRRLRCACHACARLLGETPSTRWTLVRHRVERLVDFRLSDDEWHTLGLPIDLAFFVRSGAVDGVVARYPSPGGAVESGVPRTAWNGLVAAHPCLAGLRPEVEAFLVNRTGSRRDHYLVSIDECYRLVGSMRRHWRGFSGGAEVQAQIAQFFAELDGEGGAA